MGFGEKVPGPSTSFRASCFGCLLVSAAVCLFSFPAFSQVFTVGPDRSPEQLGGNLKDVQPTAVPLSGTPLSERTRQELIRTFQAEQAFAVRPLPLGRRGLVLHANGPLAPSGEAYVEELDRYGISSKPGDRVVISKFDIKPDSIVFEFNGGPETHHHIMRHIELGGSVAAQPLAQDDGQEPTGSRLTLVFGKFVPEMEAYQLRGLIAPLVDFSLKTPAQAYADTLPSKLKTAVLQHEVLVGMNREMVLSAVGRPDQKVRDTDGNVPFEEWIYGEPPHEVQFVRFHGNRVVRLEIADVGQPPVIRDKDETGGYLSSGEFVHEVRMGDAAPRKTGEEAAAPANAPTLRQPGEKLPDAVEQQNPLRKVRMPSDTNQTSPASTPPASPPPANGTTAGAGPNGVQ